MPGRCERVIPVFLVQRHEKIRNRRFLSLDALSDPHACIHISRRLPMPIHGAFFVADAFSGA